MLATLEQIVERLVLGYDPDRIILFGSHATGTADEDSDLDLLVVKETEDRPVDRRIKVERLLADRSTPLDIHIYTPDEMRTLFKIGDPFIEEVLEKGKVVYMRKATAAWVGEAHDDFDTASILITHEKHRGVCLHSQQAVEKGLKALLLEKGERPPHTHDILDLLNRVKTAGWQMDLNIDDAIFLNSIYRGRYATDEGLLPHGEPGAEDAQRALTAAGNIVTLVDTLQSPPAPQDVAPEPESEPERPNTDRPPDGH